MSLFNTADKVYIGSSVVDKVYLGSNLVWTPSVEEPPVDLTRGPEKVVNGDMSLGTASWTDGNGALLTADNGTLRITRQSITNPFAHQMLSLTTGKTYEIKATIVSQTLPTAQNILRVGTAPGSGNYLDSRAAGARSITTTFVAQTSPLYVAVLYLTGSTGEYMNIDNISVKEIL